MKKNLFNAKIAEKGIKKQDLAKELGMLPQTFSVKLKSGVWSMEEVKQIKKILDLTDEEVSKIFLTD